MDAQLCVKKNSVSVMEHAFYQGNVGRLFADVLTAHSNNNYLVIYSTKIVKEIVFDGLDDPNNAINGPSLARQRNAI